MCVCEAVSVWRCVQVCVRARSRVCFSLEDNLPLVILEIISLSTQHAQLGVE